MRVLLYAVIGLSVTACATVRGLRSDPLDEGVARTFSTDVRRAVLASRNAVASTALEIREFRQVDDATWYLIARGAYDELVRVVCQQTSDTEVTIRVLTRKDDFLDRRRDWSPDLFAQIELELQTER